MSYSEKGRCLTLNSERRMRHQMAIFVEKSRSPDIDPLIRQTLSRGRSFPRYIWLNRETNGHVVMLL